VNRLAEGHHDCGRHYAQSGATGRIPSRCGGPWRTGTTALRPSVLVMGSDPGEGGKRFFGGVAASDIP
jgi:hypothetical protein